MSVIAAAQWTAVGTIVLALFAVVTAVFAFFAFRAQAAQVATLKEQAGDQEKLIDQQGELLQIQSRQLEVQQLQLDDQRALNAEQAGLMELQAQELRESLDDRKREAAERRRAQARLIAAVLGPEEQPEAPGSPYRTAVDLTNGSPEPVYRLVVAQVAIQGAAPRTIEEWLRLRDDQPDTTARYSFPLPTTTANILASGRGRVWVNTSGGGMGVRFGAEVAFTDRAGSHWIRRATGQLEELDEDPITHYLGAGPHDLGTPERLS